MFVTQDRTFLDLNSQILAIEDIVIPRRRMSHLENRRSDQMALQLKSFTEEYIGLYPTTALSQKDPSEGVMKNIQPVLYPPSGPPIKFMSLQFRDKDVMGDSVKGFTQVQDETIYLGLKARLLLDQYFEHNAEAGVEAKVTFAMKSQGKVPTSVQDQN
ncbi:hypothetical protein AAES_00801 [Amazona aestiva]|uniref:Uncharacterized protein n=1 Tax=Amazona aestiva TaxID=12930 RepID=A0A0Q3XAR3_AMAAE|nr:hypothetical protein AAES_00801 [Amazona aestiva]